MAHTKIHTDKAPAAIGPYSQAMRAKPGELVFCSGQVALHPETQEMVQGDVQTEARVALTNLMAVLDAAGASAADVVKCTVYLIDMNDFAAVNAVYSEFFVDTKPARAAVQVAGLPKGAQVEIDAFAVIGG